MNTSGNTIIPMPWAACALPANRPIVMNSHSNANPKTITSPNAASPSIAEPWRLNPTANAIGDGERGAPGEEAVSAIARAASTEPRGIGSERSRSMNPCSRSSAIAAAVPDAGEQHSGRDEPGHQVVDVGHPGDVDRAAEHVAVDQEEQRHLDRGEHDQLRRAHVAQQRATRDGQRCSWRARSGGGWRSPGCGRVSERWLSWRAFLSCSGRASGAWRRGRRLVAVVR